MVGCHMGKVSRSVLVVENEAFALPRTPSHLSVGIVIHTDSRYGAPVNGSQVIATPLQIRLVAIG